MSRNTNRLQCRFHPNDELFEDYRAGDMICSKCGLVVGERMVDVSAEWRNFGNDNNNSFDATRVGAAQNLLYDNDDLETARPIGRITGPMNASNEQKNNRNRTQISSSDKALRSGHDAIRAMAGRVGLTKKVTNRAFLIYKHAYEQKYLRGRSQEVIVASCIYTACRQEGSPRTMKEICDISTVSLKDLGRTYNKIKRSLPSTTVAPQSIEIKDLVPRFCNQLNLEQEISVRKAAIHIAQRANEICDIQGRAPTSVAAASIYMACLAADEKKTKKDIQGPTGVSEGVIREIYRIMLPHAAKLFPTDFVFNCSLINLPVS